MGWTCVGGSGQVCSTYRVVDPSCNPLISICPRIHNQKVLNWPPPEMTKSRICHPKKMAESRTVVSLGVAGSGPKSFQGLASSVLSFFVDSGKLGGGKKYQPLCMRVCSWAVGKYAGVLVKGAQNLSVTNVGLHMCNCPCVNLFICTCQQVSKYPVVTVSLGTGSTCSSSAQLPGCRGRTC